MARLVEIALVVGAVAALGTESSHAFAGPIEGIHHLLLLTTVLLEATFELHLRALDHALLAAAEVEEQRLVNVDGVLKEIE